MKFLLQAFLTAIGVLFFIETLIKHLTLTSAFPRDWIQPLKTYFFEVLCRYTQKPTLNNSVIHQVVTAVNNNNDSSNRTPIQAMPSMFNFKSEHSISTCLPHDKDHHSTSIAMESPGNVSDYSHDILIIGIPEEAFFVSSIPFPAFGIYIDSPKYGKQFSLLPIVFENWIRF